MILSSPHPCSSGTLFSKLDLCCAVYNFIRIWSGDKWKTTFPNSTGHYEYWVMPYGLVNAPTVFQGFMNKIFHKYLHRFILIYINDILVYSQNEAEHHHHVLLVLAKMGEYSTSRLRRVHSTKALPSSSVTSVQIASR